MIASVKGFASPEPQPLDPQPPRQNTIDWLKTLELPPLPVAPAQDPYEYPKEEQEDAKKGIFAHCPLTADLKPVIQFTGKNPSYLDANGKPHIVQHGKYQKRMPTDNELKKWFVNPLTGIGTLGSPKDIWLDFDVKNFSKALECKEKALAVAEKVRELSGNATTVEETHSGGYRVFAAVPSNPGFTNFALELGGKHVGEALGEGRFTVLAPTIGPSGKPYVAYHRHDPNFKPQVPSLEEISVNPVKAKNKSKTSKSTPTAPTSTPKPTPVPVAVPGSVPLSKLASETTQKILQGVIENDTNDQGKGDRSKALTTALNELHGWANWCQKNGKAFSEDVETLAYEAGQRLGVDTEKIGRILKSINSSACTPALEYRGKDCLKHYKKVAKANLFPDKPLPSPLNAKVIPLPTATPLPKAVGGNDNSPPLPPNYGGGSGGSNPNNKGNDWCPPVAHNGELGYWVQPKKDEPPHFFPKCNFDFVIDRYFIRYKSAHGKTTNRDGGGFRLKVTFALDGTSDYAYVTAQDFLKADKFGEALIAGLGDGVSFRLNTPELQALRTLKVAEYWKREDKKYRLCDHIGKQIDGTWVFPDIQFDANGKVLTENESMWVYTPHIGEEDEIPFPDIPVTEDPNALRELLEAQREFAQVNFMRFVLMDGWVASCLHEREIMLLEEFMPIFNAYGDGGSAKTTAMESALSLIWGNSGNGMIATASVSGAYERLGKTGSIPCCWDDPPSKSKLEREALDEFVKRQYNKFPRCVRKNKQKPVSSIGVTSNHCVGETLPATATRIVGVFFPKVQVNKDAYPRLRKAMAQAPGAFRSLLTIGYNQIEVHATRKRLIPHLLNAHDRTADNWALIVWYAQRVVELVGMDIDVEAWFIENICPTLNEDQKGLDSSTDFIKRLMALHTENKAGAWNAKVITNRNHGECLALEMKTLWSALDRPGDPPPYNQKLLESVLTNKGCVRGVPTKFFATRDGVLNYLRELGKGANQGDNWIPPTLPPQTSKRALLIPKRLWDEFGFDSDALAPMPTPPTPPSDDSAQWEAWDEEDVSASSYTSVTPSYVQLQENVTDSNTDVEGALGSSLTPSYIVTKKELEKREREETTVEKVSAQEKKDDAIDAPDSSQTSKDASEKSVTSVTGKKQTPETSSPQGVELVTKDCNLGVTMGGESVTSPKTNAQTQALTPDDNLIKLGEVAHEMIQCTTPMDVENLNAQFPQELINEAKGVLGDKERLKFEAIANQCATSTATVGKLYRYVGVLTHNFKDVEGNPILVLRKGSEIVLETVGGSVNSEFTYVRPIGLDCQKLGIHRSQLEEV